MRAIESISKRLTTRVQVLQSMEQETSNFGTSRRYGRDANQWRASGTKYTGEFFRAATGERRFKQHAALRLPFS
jgi:hypothetical protein